MKKNVDNALILSRIDYFLKKNGWTRYELINQTPLSSGVLYQWYSNHETMPSLKNIESICDAFGISLSEFFAITKEEQIGAYEDELFKVCAEMNENQRQALLAVAKTMIDSGKNN